MVLRPRLRLWTPRGERGYGGELTASGVKLCRSFGFDVRPFDFLDPGSYNLLRPSTTIYTVHALEQLPTAVPFLDAIRPHREKIRWVVHLEPCWLRQRSGPLGELRNEYAIRNDYNRDLVELLQTAEDIEVHKLEFDCFGMNPLNPAHLIAWRFRE